MERTTYKSIQNTLLFFTILVLGAVLYIEYKNELEPCPLCIMQRMCAFVIGFLSFISIGMASVRRVRLVVIFQIAFAFIGLYFSLRQINIQSMPVTAGQVCMPGLDAVGGFFSIGSFIKTFFWGTVSCSEITWQALGLSMPAWAAIYFMIMVVTNITLLAFLTQNLQMDNKS